MGLGAIWSSRVWIQDSMHNKGPTTVPKLDCFGWPHPPVHRGHSWHCVQRSLLEGIGETIYDARNWTWVCSMQGDLGFILNLCFCGASAWTHHITHTGKCFSELCLGLKFLLKVIFMSDFWHILSWELWDSKFRCFRRHMVGPQCRDLLCECRMALPEISENDFMIVYCWSW